MDRDDEGRDDDADAGCFNTSRLALPLADAPSVGETITGGSEEQALSRTDRGAVCKRRKRHGFGLWRALGNPPKITHVREGGERITNERERRIKIIK